MRNVYFVDPNGKRIAISCEESLKNDIIDNFEHFWLQGSGDGYFDFYIDGKKKSTLMIGPNVIYGIYLHFMDVENGIDLLSLYNDEKLNEVAETAEEIYASVGLFLPLDIAWEVIKEFIRTGQASTNIRWITPMDIPEDGNW